MQAIFNDMDTWLDNKQINKDIKFNIFLFSSDDAHF